MPLTRAQRIIRSQSQSPSPTTPDTSILDLSVISSSDPLAPRGQIKVKIEPTVNEASINAKQVKTDNKNAQIQ